jgi:hypothetical protein
MASQYSLRASRPFAIAIAFFATLGAGITDTRAGLLYAGVIDNTFYGVATFTENLGLINHVELTTLSSPITGLSAGTGGNYYVSSANTLREFDSTNAQVRSVSGSATTTLPALSFGGGTLDVAVNDGSFRGAAFFTENLGLINQVSLASFTNPVTALTVESGGNFYASSGNTLARFDMAGNVLTQSQRWRQAKEASSTLVPATCISSSIRTAMCSTQSRVVLPR